MGVGGIALLGCAEPGFVLERAPQGSTSVSVPQTSGGAGSSGTTTEASQTGTTSVPMPACDADGSCPVKIDLLFVIDNSGTMGEEQLTLARNFGELVDELQTLTDGSANDAPADVHIMVTTTDMGNPRCDDEFKPPGYEEQRGAPVATPCTERIERFTGRGVDAPTIEAACLEVCDPAAPAAPTSHFIAFGPEGSNVEGGTPTDALACIGPQGIDGCGFESPLEAMLQALNPCACWNDPAACGEDAVAACVQTPYEQSFLREGAILAIVMITDEADCSVRDFSMMTASTFMETSPLTGLPEPSSAQCWNAGVVCPAEPDGTLSGCTPSNWSIDGSSGVSDEDAVLHPTSRYEALLGSFRAEGREVVMLGVLGVPEVTAYDDAPPFLPVQGGVADLQYRGWADPAYPAGDILPEDWDAGADAASKTFEFGIGPGCTVVTEDYAGQGIPPVRIRRVCESLDTPDDPKTAFDESAVRCCMESVCGDDFTPALRCLTELIRTAIVPVG
ncbi:MAG: vWA domain-containing protein [Myxococcota bacterium]